MYGKKYMGIERSTFLIDSKGKLIQEWRKVKVKGHAKDVLNSIDQILISDLSLVGHATRIALKKVAIGIANNKPQKPQIPPKINTAVIIKTG